MTIVRNASILFVATMAGNVANYSFQFIMGRSLSVEDYGAMNALLSVSTTITLPASAVMMVMAKYASVYAATGKDGGLSSLYRGSLTRVALLAVAVTGLFLLFAPAIRGYLRIADLVPVILLSIGILGSFLMTVNLGIIQGVQRFYWLGVGIGLGGVLRLAIGVILVYLGTGLDGAILATVLPAMFIFLITLVPLYNLLGGAGGGFSHENILKYSVPVFISSSAIAFLSNVDLVMAKHYLDPVDAGLYASVAVLGKTMLYIPSSFALALFPMVSSADLVNGDSFRILDKALICTALIGAAGLAVFALFPDLLITLLFGQRFVEAEGYLKYYAFAMTLMSLLSILISFNLARGSTQFVYSLAAGCAMTVAAIWFFHANILEVVLSLTAVFFIVTAYNLIQSYRERHAFYRAYGDETYKTASAAFDADRDGV